MATQAELEKWTALGGKVEEKTTGKRVTKTWVGPDGKKLRSWKEAAALLEAAEAGRKRGQASPDVAADDKENSKKRLKADKAAANNKDAACDADAAADAVAGGDDKAAGAAKAAKATPAAKKAAARKAPSAAKKSSAKKQKKEEEAAAAEEEEAEAEPMDAEGPGSAEANGDAADGSDGGSDGEGEGAEEAPRAAVGSGRRAAQGMRYKEVSMPRESKADHVKAEEEPKAESEEAAIKETAAARSGGTRRLLHFAVVDEAGDAQPLDRLGLVKGQLKLKGAVYPEEGPLNKADGRLLAEPFGPVSSWHVRFTAAGPQAVAVTAGASYLLSKPMQPYRKVFAALEEQATLAWHIVMALDADLGGSPSASLDAVVAKLARAKAGKGYATAREALLLNGRFVLAQLSAHEARRAGAAAAAADKGKGKAAAGAGTFAAELEAELAKGPVRVGVVSGNAITINDAPAANGGAGGEAPDALTAADEDMARRLQAKMDAESLGVGKPRGAGAGRGGAAAYIKISEAEIADDYPMPQQYKVPEGAEETDELLLWDEEMADVDPELLPKRLLTDFSIYNAEGFFASLELLPMWSGVDPDVELFASGVVKDDEGDWGVGGQPLELGSGKAAAAAPAARGKGKKNKGAAAEAKEAEAAGGSSAAGAAGGSSAAAGGSSAAAGGSSAAAGGSSAAAGGSSAAAGGSSAAAGGSSAAAEPDAEPAAAAGEADVAVDEGPDPVAEGGMRLMLSQIREWVVEFSADMLFISIRTDAAWYKLCRPNPKYAPWFGVPLKSARVALSVISALAQQSRASRLSFGDVAKLIAEAPPGSTTFVSKKADRVERFLVVHGQILLNQVKAYPNAAVQRSPFVSALKERMEMRRHSKLYYSKRGFSKLPSRVNRNPMKDRASSSRPKPMPATATTMVRSIWQNYFYSMEGHVSGEGSGEEQQQPQQDGTEAPGSGEAKAAAGDKGEAAAAAAEASGVAEEVEDPSEEEEEADEQEDALAGAGSPARRKGAAGKKKKGTAAAKKGAKAAAGKKAGASAAAATGGKKKVSWVGASTGADDGGRRQYRAAQVGQWKVELGSVVVLEADVPEGQEDGDEEQQHDAQHVFGLVQCLFEDEDGDRMAQIRMLVPGAETVLGDAAAAAELFATEDFEDVLLPDVVGLAAAKRLVREFDPELRAQQFAEDEALRERNAAAKAAGEPLEYFYRHLYVPQQGMFRALPEDLELGAYVAPLAPPVELGLLPKAQGFVKAGVEYRKGDFLYVQPDAFDAPEGDSGSDDDGSGSGSEGEEEEEAKDKKADLPAYANKKGRYHKGSCAGLRAWALARLVEVKEAGGSSSRGGAKSGLPGKLKLQRYYRPEDVGKDEAYGAAYWDLFASPPAPASGTAEWVAWVDVDAVMRKCAARAAGAPLPEGAEGLDCFDVRGTYNPATKAVSGPPAEFAPPAAPAAGARGGSAESEEDDGHDLRLATMDIFAGCGGLSEGMHQAGVADSKWAIEYEQPAADAFKLNNPDAAVFCNNCNVILVAAMQKAGLDKDCSSCEDARNLAAAMPSEEVARLPAPGEVEFIMGGPPCQGYSGMNRFNKGNWSMVQNSMVMSFLSYADFYRPRYFLLENVRNFVSHNKSFTFRLTLRTLLDMGYQVRFGVLNAGNYGVPQSRKRTFIWAAAPDEGLPSWPQPRHVFRSPQLTVNLPGGVAYCAVDTRTPGAPLRTVTVRDAISDLPAIENGHDQDVMEYTGPAVSAFQKAMRGKAAQLRDHICKEMNPLNLERCRCIPKDTPGADWRVLLEIVKNDPSREKFNGQPLVPWCLPNTADRHNGWRGLFGRLDLSGHFPTSTTDPQPMGKVGQVFHPHQDRIVSVRECARSQGFPDHFYFSGNVHNRHRQVGNAVPPPLAAALGRQLRRAVKAKHERQLAALTSGL